MITFNYEEIEWRLTDEKPISLWIKNIAREYEIRLRELNYIFCNDEYLLKLNERHLKHDYYTDILTFNNSDGRKKEVFGDVYISIDRVIDNAKVYNVPLQDEVHRVIAHGILHLIGFDDQDPISKQEMTDHEDAALALRSFV